jgi:hypothetical protein
MCLTCIKAEKYVQGFEGDAWGKGLFERPRLEKVNPFQPQKIVALEEQN